MTEAHFDYVGALVFICAGIMTLHTFKKHLGTKGYSLWLGVLTVTGVLLGFFGL